MKDQSTYDVMYDDDPAAVAAAVAAVAIAVDIVRVSIDTPY